MKRVLKEGDATRGFPGKGAAVRMHYVGSRMDGQGFDQSVKRDQNRAETKAFEFTLGAKEVIKGWDHGVACMRHGEIACLMLRQDYAYGAAGDPGTCDEDEIPKNATLRFECELVGWEGGAKGTGKLGGSSACALL